MSVVSPVLLWLITASPVVSIVAAILAVATRRRAFAQAAVGAFAAGLALCWGLGIGFAAGAFLHDDPAMRATIIAGAVAEAMNTSFFASLGLPSAAVGLWVLRRSPEAPPAG